MFTGIIEAMGKVEAVQRDGANFLFDIRCPWEAGLKVDQSIAHDGVCLTLTHLLEQQPGAGTLYRVAAVEETLQKTRLGDWAPGTVLNLERSMSLGSRLDGHFVQGHVDGVGTVMDVSDREGSWMIRIGHDAAFSHLLVPKGSVCVNGVSLTVVSCPLGAFEIAIIPYTYEHTNIGLLKPGDRVNLEFDVLGKYIARIMELRA